jgi:hypothetical protein
VSQEEPDLGYGGEPSEGLPDFETTLSGLPNGDLLAALDLTLLQLERRLYQYATAGADIVQMADEGLVLAVRTLARLAQTRSAAEHAQSHLQVVAVGDWRPQSPQPRWNADPRLTEKPLRGGAEDG